jgi:hypothetical protein
MPDSVITRIIRDNSLKPGDVMRTIHGDEITGSRVIGGSMVVYPQDDHHLLVSESVLTGEETRIILTPDMLSQLGAYAA